MEDYMPRVIETNITEEDIRIEGTLRPQTLDDYIGQEKAKENLRFTLRRPDNAETRWIMFCFTGRPAWAKPRWQALSPMKWVSI